MSAGVFVVLLLAVYRATGLVVRDRLLERPRAAIAGWSFTRQTAVDLKDLAPGDVLAQVEAEGTGGLAYLVTCWWCSGLWVSAGWTVFWWAAPTACWWVSLALALSGGLVLVHRLESLLRERAEA